MRNALANLFQSPRKLLRNVLQLEDSAHSIALGVSIGLFVGLTPTVGAQMICVLILAAVCRPLFQFNKLAAIMAVHITNPVTLVPIYYFQYWLGTRFLEGQLTRAEFAEMLRYSGLDGWLATITAMVIQVGWPLLTGSLIVAVPCGILAYPAMRMLVRWYRSPARSPKPPEIDPSSLDYAAITRQSGNQDSDVPPGGRGISRVSRLTQV